MLNVIAGIVFRSIVDNKRGLMAQENYVLFAYVFVLKTVIHDKGIFFWSETDENNTNMCRSPVGTSVT